MSGRFPAKGNRDIRRMDIKFFDNDVDGTAGSAVRQSNLRKMSLGNLPNQTLKH